MLREILIAFGGEKILAASSLAHRVGVQEPLLLQMLGDLVRMGYLMENTNCTSSCAGCGHAAACGLSKAQHMWLLTAKGQKFINE